MSKDEEYKTMNIPMSGRLITALDGTQLGEGDFQILKNMRYTDASIKSVSGMTKINTSVMNSSYYRPRSGFQFRMFRPLAIPTGIASGGDTGGGTDPGTNPPPAGTGPDISGLDPKLMMNLPHMGSSFGAYSFSSQSPTIGQSAYYYFEIPATRRPTSLEFYVQTMTAGGIGDFEMWVTDPAGNVFYQGNGSQLLIGFRDGTSFSVLTGYYLIKIIMNLGTYFFIQASFKPEEDGPYPWEFTTKICTDEADANQKSSDGTWYNMWATGYPYIY